MDAKRADEAKFKAQVAANPQWKAAYGSAWDQIAAAEKKAQTRFKEQYFHGLNSSLASLAQQIVQYVAEIKKPDGERLAGYHESQLESLRLAIVLARADLSRHGNRAHHRRPGAGFGGSWAQRSLGEDGAERKIAARGRHGAGERHQADRSGSAQETGRRRRSPL